MRNVIRKTALTVYIIALASCARDNEGVFAKKTPKPFRMTVWADADATKTIIAQEGDNYNVNWKTGDKLAVYEVANGAVQAKSTSAALSSGGAEASFTFSLTPEVSGPYAYNFVSPASALGIVDGTYAVTIPSAQVFPVGSFDPEADVLVAEYQDTPTRPSSITARFARLGGTAKMTILAPTTTENVLWVTLESRDACLAGSYFLSPVSGDLDDTPFVGENTLRLFPATDTQYSGSFDVWFRTTDAILSHSLTVTVQTSSRKYIKTINLEATGKTIEFHNGQLSKFSVDMTSIAGIDTSVDVLTTNNTSSKNSYTSWEKNSGMPSGAHYWGQTYAVSNSLQMNTSSSNGKHHGIVSTQSAGYVKSVTLITTTAYDNRFDVYGKIGNYTDANDLYDNSKKGQKQGSVYPSTEAVKVGTVDFSGNYTGVGIRVSGGASQASKIFIVWGGEPGATANVTTGLASSVDHASAVLAGSYTDATGTIQEVGFYWDTNSDNLAELENPDQYVIADDTTTPFSAKVSSLNENTTYYYKAYVLEYDGTSGTSVKRFGDIHSFTTTSKATYVPGGWLEMPTSVVNATTTESTLSDLYAVTHKAMLEGKLQRNYSILYDPEVYASYWVAYPLCATHLGSGRSEFWAFDPEVPTSKQTDIHKGAYGVKWPTANYANNYFARGHQLPNADRNSDAASEAMLEQTYYSTNLTPQLQYGFNGDIWKNLEDGVRSCVSGSDTVYVVTGAAFKKVNGSETINKITSVRDGKLLPVPNYYWKVLLKVKWTGSGDNKSVTSASAIGFWLDHWASYSTASTAYIPCAVSVDQIEEWTGFDFFVNLPESLQNTCETNTDWTTFKNY